MALKAQSSRLRTPDAAGIGRGGRWSLVDDVAGYRISNIEHRCLGCVDVTRLVEACGSWHGVRGSWFEAGLDWVPPSTRTRTVLLVQVRMRRSPSEASDRCAALCRSRMRQSVVLRWASHTHESHSGGRGSRIRVGRVRYVPVRIRPAVVTVSEQNFRSLARGSNELDQSSGGARRRCDTPLTAKLLTPVPVRHQ